MGKPIRGQATKDKLLEVAGSVFAEKGYRDATHAEICRRAHTNAAAINYHFGSKEGLYRAVFERLIQKTEALYPLDGGLPPTADPEARLRAFIQARLNRIFDPDNHEKLHRICMLEIFDPTGLLVEPLSRQLAKDREHIVRALRELLGPQASPEDVTWCEMSIVGQCFFTAQRIRDGVIRTLLNLNADDVKGLTEHIVAFSLGGIASIRERLRRPAET
ncbi:MAG TPA: CerR family C-terminal domain-containing protein [Candidatus Hydrogenedentes bacterium]|nr:CerR family C-terminal domain-containing protein [Candidatus Hydrogenedentota bacterium]HOS01894.1 CerR family C-terminal domain-containing protein [Candidatus Hydrogenedentota bacterium]